MTWEEFEKSYRRKNRGKAAHSEHDLQVSCVNWFRLQYPQLLIYAIPNGGYRTYTTASTMKAEGQTAGIPDLCIPIARGSYAALYIEMKNGKAGRLSDIQKRMHLRLQKLGNCVAVCHTVQEFVSTVQKYLLLPENDKIMTKTSTACEQMALNL